MPVVFLILIVLACVLLGLFVLVQNPKGGGLSSSFGGLNTQFMGVKQTTDVLEKGTWILAAAVALLCIFSAAFLPTQGTDNGGYIDRLNTRPTTNNAAPANPPSAAPAQPAPGNR